jgi:enoyl-CoA hydratase/carnithine racemase
MSDEMVTLEIEGLIATVAFNRTDRLNAYGWEMGGALVAVMERVAADGDVRAVILKGNGRAFCAGLDLRGDVRERIVGRSAAERVRNYYQRFRGSHRRMQLIEELPQPLIVAVHGYCLGAGLEVAMLGDIRLAAETTTFAAPEVQIGVAIDGGLDMRLAEEVGPAGRSGSPSVAGASMPPRRWPSAWCRRSTRKGNCSPRPAASPRRSPPMRRWRCRGPSAPSTCGPSAASVMRSSSRQ